MKIIFLLFILVNFGCGTNQLMLPKQDAEKSKYFKGESQKLSQGEIDGDLIPIFVPAPRYPSKVIKYRLNGYVVLEFDVERDGTVSNIHVIESYPMGVFDEAAVKAGEGLKYEPIIKENKSVKVHNVLYKFGFKMAR